MCGYKKSEQNGIIGIDAGGTFTDVVFWGKNNGSIIAKVKTPTLRGDIPGTIESGLNSILKNIPAERIEALNLATTFATNAVVENKLCPSALILIGYEKDLADKIRNESIVNSEYIYTVNGGHGLKGNELARFDETAFRNVCAEIFKKVNAVAISSYFSVRNPSHEIRAREIIQKEYPHAYVTCGHELVAELDAIKRATTASLNVGLIPIIIDLLDSVEETCLKKGIKVPIMIARSDGSLVSMNWAREHPIETVLSGPAASAIGAGYLSNVERFARAAYVVDMGGTTTDIIHLGENGHPSLGDEGVIIGGYKTLLKSIDVYTFGLGGDSRVRYGKDRSLVIGPRRVRPLCSAAEEYPTVYDCLQNIRAGGSPEEPIVVFKGDNEKPEGVFEEKILTMLENNPSTMEYLLKDEKLANMCIAQLDDMERRGLIKYSGFTPTDAITALGFFAKWDKKASLLGAKILSAALEMDADELCGKVCEEVSRIAAKNVFIKSILRDGSCGDVSEEMKEIIGFALNKKAEGKPSITLGLNAELIGVGAPAWTFLSRAGEMLGEKGFVPQDAEVAGAVGAAVGTFFMRLAVLITPLNTGKFRAHLPTGICDYEDLEYAVSNIVEKMSPWISARAEKAGAVSPIIRYEREDTEVEMLGGFQKVRLFTHLYFNVACG
ncbi:MAG: hydantoinase/oxoprolinase family protein [bacterium]|nr:hydantoinase/oxoprolinase family protein [bacterium]